MIFENVTCIDYGKYSSHDVPVTRYKEGHFSKESWRGEIEGNFRRQSSMSDRGTRKGVKQF